MHLNARHAAHARALGLFCRTGSEMIGVAVLEAILESAKTGRTISVGKSAGSVVSVKLCKLWGGHGLSSGCLPKLLLALLTSMLR